MNEEQYKEFGMIAQQCDSRQYGSINVASNVRSDAIVAAFHDLTRLREQRDALAAALRLLLDNPHNPFDRNNALLLLSPLERTDCVADMPCVDTQAE